jgi:hypothetical protein
MNLDEWKVAFGNLDWIEQSNVIYLISKRARSDPETIMSFLASFCLSSEPNMPDKLRAIALLGSIRFIRSNPGYRYDILRACEPILKVPVGAPISASSGWTVGPCLKFVASFLHLRYCRDKDYPAVLSSILDAAAHFTELVQSWSTHITYDYFTELLEYESHRFTGDISLFFLDLFAACLIGLDDNWLDQHVFPKLKQHVEEKVPFAVPMLMKIILPGPIPQGAYFEELPQLVQDFLRNLALGDLTSIPTSMLVQLNVPNPQTALETYIQTPLPTERRHDKRFPTLAGVDETDWTQLGHAYGDASDSPTQLGRVISLNPEIRKRAFHSLSIGANHQGNVYSCTAPLAKWMLKFLEYSMQQDKAQIIRWLISVAIGNPTEYCYKRFAMDFRMPADGGEDFRYNPAGPKHIRDCYTTVLEGYPILANVLANETTDIEAATQAACSLSYFPPHKSDTVALIVSILKSSDHRLEHPSFKGTLFMTLSGLVVPVDAEYHTVAAMFSDVWQNADPSETQSARYLRSVAMFCHLRMLQDNFDPLPMEWRVTAIELMSLPATPPWGEYKPLVWPWDFDLLPQAVTPRKSEFMDLLLEKLRSATSPADAEGFASLLLKCCWARPYSFWSTSSSVPDWYDLRVAFLDDLQRKALRVIAETDLCWSRACSKGDIQDAINKFGECDEVGLFSGLQKELQNFLEVGHPICRDQLLLTLEKLDSLPPISKDDIASGTVDTNKHNRARFL